MKPGCCMRRKALYIIYKRIRPAFGLPLGFILMYGFFVNSISLQLILAGIVFVLIEIYAGLYNDYWDYDEDVKNKRKDKLTTSGLLTLERVKYLAFSLAGAAIILAAFTNTFVLFVALYAVIMFTFYSHPKFKLKGRIWGYLEVSTIFFFIPIALNTLLLPEFYPPTLIFSAYCFLQFAYILFQKDSTDPEDKKNIFLTHGWEKSTIATSVIGVLASLSLLIVCLFKPVLLLVWFFNAFTKFSNLNSIRNKTITRTLRSRLILFEFLTPYLFIGVNFL